MWILSGFSNLILCSFHVFRESDEFAVSQQSTETTNTSQLSTLLCHPILSLFSQHLQEIGLILEGSVKMQIPTFRVILFFFHFLIACVYMVKFRQLRLLQKAMVEVQVPIFLILAISSILFCNKITFSPEKFLNLHKIMCT